MAKCKPTPAAKASLITPAVAELVALGAAVAAHCEPCFKHHYNQARKLGVAADDMARAVELADQVSRATARNMLRLADKLLGSRLADAPAAAPPAECCSAPPVAKSKRGAGCSAG